MTDRSNPMAIRNFPSYYEEKNTYIKQCSNENCIENKKSAIKECNARICKIKVWCLFEFINVVCLLMIQKKKKKMVSE